MLNVKMFISVILSKSARSRLRERKDASKDPENAWGIYAASGSSHDTRKTHSLPSALRSRAMTPISRDQPILPGPLACDCLYDFIDPNFMNARGPQPPSAVLA